MCRVRAQPQKSPLTGNPPGGAKVPSTPRMHFLGELIILLVRNNWFSYFRSINKTGYSYFRSISAQDVCIPLNNTSQWEIKLPPSYHGPGQSPTHSLSSKKITGYISASSLTLVVIEYVFRLSDQVFIPTTPPSVRAPPAFLVSK